MRKHFLPVLLLLSLFSLSVQANMACFQDPEGQGGNQQKKQQRDGMMADMQDPAQDLLMCYLAAGFQKPKDILNDVCGCKEAVRELCDFDFKRGSWKVTAKGGAEKAWCAVFLPASF